MDFRASRQTNLQTNRGLPNKYRTTRLSAAQFPFRGADILLEHSLLANKMSGLSKANYLSLAAAARYSLAS